MYSEKPFKFSNHAQICDYSEKPYEFRKRLDRVHRPGIRNYLAAPAAGEIEIDRSWCIEAEDASGRGSAAADLQDYMQTCMGISLPLGSGERCIQLQETGEKGFDWLVGENVIRIRGNIRKGVHYLEDLMNFREAPFLEQGQGRREPLFTPRMVHSGWGLDQFPDSHLDAIAHAGFDTVLLFVQGVDLTTHGAMDFNDLIYRAGNYGLGIYFYSYLDSNKHPDEPDAEEFFDHSFGSVFKACPGAKGLILVGESCNFPSKDERAFNPHSRNGDEIDSRPPVGFFPCRDYPQWLEAVKKAVRRYQPAADIVFWTYNFGNQPFAYRRELIEQLPTDVSLEVTFEMYQRIQYPNHVMVSPDYSITFPGPGQYFTGEAETAHRRGLKLYAMTNTAGMTWDCGMIPYMPVPQQWFKRLDAIHRARENWGLCGLMDSHHYGWFGSPVSECAKWSFWSPAPPMEEILHKIAVRDFGSAAADKVIDAWRQWSDAVNSYTPGFDDQAGPLRVGPAYPFIFHPVLYPHNEQQMKFPVTPQSAVGDRWLHAFYQPEHIYNHTYCGRRIHEDIRIMTAALKKWDCGSELMREALALVPESKLTEAKLQAGVGFFFGQTLRTMVHIKRWWLLNKRLEIEYDPDNAAALIDELEELIRAERKNVEAALPLVDADSRLGWEPSMDYMADRSHLEWKLRQLDNLLTHTFPAYRQTLFTNLTE